MFAEPLRLVHHHPGRIRARATVFLDAPEDHPVVVAARTAAATATGFRSWSHSPKTGSILVEYQPGVIDPDELLQRIAVGAGLQGVVHGRPSPVKRGELLDTLHTSVRSLNRAAHQATAGRADLRELIPAALVVTSAVSFLLNGGSGRLPRWDNALWWAQCIFLEWHRPELVAKAGVGVLGGPGDTTR